MSTKLSQKVREEFFNNMKMGDCFARYLANHESCIKCMVSKDCKKATENDDKIELEEAIVNTVSPNKTRKTIYAKDVIEMLSEKLELIKELTGKKGTALRYDFEFNGKTLSVVTTKAEDCQSITYYLDGDRENGKVTIEKIKQGDVDKILQKMSE